MRETHKKETARALRRSLTEAEQRLWYRLRDRRLNGIKFRRQCPVGPYIADFACMEYKLIIEVDGGQHATCEDYDHQRDKFLQDQGFTTLRFWNNEVLQNTDTVLEMILNYVSPHPLPQAGEGIIRSITE